MKRIFSPFTVTLLSSMLSGMLAAGCGINGDVGSPDATGNLGNSGNAADTAADTAADAAGSVSGSAVITPPPPPFYITSDGQVRTPTTTYQSIRAWYLSREFLSREKCRAHDITQRYPTIAGKTGDLGPLASPNHCTMGFTDIEAEYALQDTNLVVPVVFHNIVRTDNVGFLSDEQILSQIEVLNEDFGKLEGTPGDGGPQSNDVHLRFVLAGINRVQNDNWFDYPETYELDYKSALAWDSSEYLNVYTVGFADGDEPLLGWAYFPQGAAGQDSTDGVVLLYDTVGRDAPNAPFNQGRTATHEVGHYLGLLHTFDPNDNDGLSGTCENGWDRGDLIQDTPEEAEPTFGCPAQYQSCGLDVPSTMGNVHNYMDYTNDACMYYFTIQQANRAVCSLVNYRPSLYRDVPATYSVRSYIKTTPSGTGSIQIFKRRVPAGSQIVLEALPVVPSNQPVPTWNARLRLARKLVGQEHFEEIELDISSGMTPASIVHTVPVDAFYQWSVTRDDDDNVAPGPYTANLTFLDCYDPVTDGTKDLPECQF